MNTTLKSLSLLLSALLAVSVSYSCRKSSDAEPAAEAPADITPLTVTGCIGGADTKVTYTIGSSKVSQKWAVGDTIIGIDNSGITCTYYVTKVSKDTASFSLVKGGSGSRCGTATDNPSVGTTMYMIYAPGYAAKDFKDDGSLSIDISKQDTTTVGTSASGLHIPAIMTATGEVSGDNKLELTFANQLELLMIKNPTFSGLTAATDITSFMVFGSDTLPTTATFSASGFTVGSTKGTVTKKCRLMIDDATTGTTTGTVLIALLPASTQNLYIRSSNAYADTITSHTPTASRLLSVSGATFKNNPNAPLSGVFTVDESGTTVNFSKGNLQYLGTGTDGTKTPQWRFADNQYDYMGSGNGNVTIYGYDTYNTGSGIAGPSENDADKQAARDLFGWGATGFQDTRTTSTGYQINYMPYSTSQTAVSEASSYNYYGYGPDYDSTNKYGLTLASKSDWGVNIGGGSTWRTLTSAEWNYLLTTRSGDKAPEIGTQTDARYAEVKVNGVGGMLIFPDTFTWPEGITTSKPTQFNWFDSRWNSVDYTAAEFVLLESAGCVFLSAAGFRVGSSMLHLGARGYYWSSTPLNSSYAYCLYFSNSNTTRPTYSYYRDYGYSVRLVK